MKQQLCKSRQNQIFSKRLYYIFTSIHLNIISKMQLLIPIPKWWQSTYIHVECCWSVFVYHKFAVYSGLSNAVYHYSLCASACRNTSCRGLTWLANCWRQVVVVVVVAGKGNSEEQRQREGSGTKQGKKERRNRMSNGWLMAANVCSLAWPCIY